MSCTSEAGLLEIERFLLIVDCWLLLLLLLLWLLSLLPVLLLLLVLLLVVVVMKEHACNHVGDGFDAMQLVGMSYCKLMCKTYLL